MKNKILSTFAPKSTSLSTTELEVGSGSGDDFSTDKLSTITSTIAPTILSDAEIVDGENFSTIDDSDFVRVINKFPEYKTNFINETTSSTMDNTTKEINNLTSEFSVTTTNVVDQTVSNHLGKTSTEINDITNASTIDYDSNYETTTTYSEIDPENKILDDYTTVLSNFICGMIGLFIGLIILLYFNKVMKVLKVPKYGILYFVILLIWVLFTFSSFFVVFENYYNLSNFLGFPILPVFYSLSFMIITGFITLAIMKRLHWGHYRNEYIVTYKRDGHSD